jgi:peptidylprolyl isomerase
MKRLLPVLLFFVAIIVTPAFYFSKGKEQPRPAGDTVVRRYQTKPVKKPKVVMLTPDSLQYTITSKGNGPLPEKGDKIAVLYTGKLTNDTVFDASSRHGYAPFAFHIGKHEVIPGWDSILIRLHGGDKAILRIPGKYAYGAMARGPIPANATLIFEVEIISITPKPKMWDAKGKDTITTPSGLKMVFFESHPDSIMPKSGHPVTVDYSGFLLDGSMFDSSIERKQPFTFRYGVDPVIKGWSEGVGLMHKGDRAKLIIPYNLGYGDHGSPGVIPPKATLIFDVTLLNVN